MFECSLVSNVQTFECSMFAYIEMFECLDVRNFDNVHYSRKFNVHYFLKCICSKVRTNILTSNTNAQCSMAPDVGDPKLVTTVLGPTLC